MEDGETVDLVVNYEFRLPFSVFGLKNVGRPFSASEIFISGDSYLESYDCQWRTGVSAGSIVPKSILSEEVEKDALFLWEGKRN